MNGATLEFDFMNGFAPKLGDKFNFLAFGTVYPTNSMFSQIQITGLEPGFQYPVAPDPTNPASFSLVTLNDGVSTTVPEPATWALMIAGMCIGVRLHCVRRRASRL